MNRHDDGTGLNHPGLRQTAALAGRRNACHGRLCGKRHVFEREGQIYRFPVAPTAYVSTGGDVLGPLFWFYSQRVPFLKLHGRNVRGKYSSWLMDRG